MGQSQPAPIYNLGLVRRSLHHVADAARGRPSMGGLFIIDMIKKSASLEIFFGVC